MLYHFILFKKLILIIIIIVINHHHHHHHHHHHCYNNLTNYLLIPTYMYSETQGANYLAPRVPQGTFVVLGAYKKREKLLNENKLKENKYHL